MVLCLNPELCNKRKQPFLGPVVDCLQSHSSHYLMNSTHIQLNNTMVWSHRIQEVHGDGWVGEQPLKRAQKSSGQHCLGRELYVEVSTILISNLNIHPHPFLPTPRVASQAAALTLNDPCELGDPWSWGQVTRPELHPSAYRGQQQLPALAQASLSCLFSVEFLASPLSPLH